ncbi:hypothetical protein LAWI1_G004137 [Lachnellula willkommii]|uniref:F-box domain-containing protein n=1 Tax=Lachnellula willkommii TaxID=215461 RepID=A0A559MJ93_9HELO|nr:hypothetical protein LAWI1_G004137 [Lachnellula willkommii]
MSPNIFDCIICGFPFYDSLTISDSKSWLKEFRAIYSDPLGTFLSGVGCQEDPGDSTWIAPSDPNMRWDDDEYHSPASDELPVMRLDPVNGRHGFILHDACWHLLQRAFQPSEIPLERLVEVCESLPFPLRGNVVSWGHDYGGLHTLDDLNYYPWDDRLLEECHNGKVLLYAKSDPYDVPEIPKLLVTRLEHPIELPLNTQLNDCFSRLPWEILEAVAVNLPTDDALGLRCISPAFLRLLASATFWASRFKASADRSFIFETWKSRNVTDWMSLYRLTARTHGPSGLQNRRRIWDLIRPLEDITSLRLADNLKTTSLDEEFACLRWSKVAGVILNEVTYVPSYFNEGCRIFGTHVARIPKDLSKIGVSVSSFANVTYISGIRLITERGPDICLGFISKGQEVIQDVTALGGFILAVGSRGVHALQVVGQDARLSKWVGCPNKSPITERLAHFNFIAGLQGYKIVSFGLLGEASPPIMAPSEQGSSLGKAALWYPKVPKPKLFLNEASFTGENPSHTGYRPFFWVHFGGPGGSYLENVTGVSIYYGYQGLYSLEFHYDDTYDLAGTFRLGRCASTDLKIRHFPIDGASGEIIESLEVTLVRYDAEKAFDFLKHGILNSVKITTNRQRSIYVSPSSDDGISKPLVIAPGTTLTGFYASQA